MKRPFFHIPFVLLFAMLSTVTFAQNPVIQTNYTADPAPMVHNGTVYLYTTHDEDVTVRNFFTMNDWKCYSTTDMVNWTDHGTILSYKDFSWARGDAWAGQCIFRNGKYYFYVPVNKKNGGNVIGVAVSDSPTGPFKDAIGKPLLEGYGYIDPTVFIDDDGQAYLYWGNPDLSYVKLNPDMVSYSGEVVKVEFTSTNFGVRTGDAKRKAQYEEGPWFYKRSGKYYMLYPAGGVPEHLAYSTSPGPLGPWTYGDTIMPIIGKGGAFTNHPGYIDFKGRSFLFYHNGDLPGGGGYKRSVCVAEFTYNKDGSIPRIQHTVEGVTKSVGNLNPLLRSEAETIAFESGIETARNEKTGMYVTDVDNGDYIKVRSVDFNKPVKTFQASVATASQGGKIELHVDGLTGPLLGTLEVKSTGGFQTWALQSCKVSSVKGVHDLYFVFKGGDGDLFNMDWWVFYSK